MARDYITDLDKRAEEAVKECQSQVDYYERRKAKSSEYTGFFEKQIEALSFIAEVLEELNHSRKQLFKLIQVELGKTDVQLIEHQEGNGNED